MGKSLFVPFDETNIHFSLTFSCRFRKPNLELICVYAVQNPFLYGMYELRREQMKMQQESLEANLKTGTKVRFLWFRIGLEIKSMV